MQRALCFQFWYILPDCPPKKLQRFTVPTSMSIFQQILQAMSLSIWVKMLFCCFICISLITNAVKHLLICLYATNIYFSVNSMFTSFANSSIKLLDFLLLLVRTLYIYIYVHMYTLVNRKCCKYFSPVCYLLFNILIMFYCAVFSFYVVKHKSFFSSMSSGLEILSLA